MARKKRELGNDTYFTVFNKDLKLIHDPVKKILFSKIKNWIYRNEDKESGFHFRDGHYWTFGSQGYWAEECGLQVKTVGDNLRELVATGILKTGNYNRLGIDKTIWYRLATDDEMKNVNLRALFYGKTKCNNPGNHSNETILAMYQNGMLDMNNTDIEKEQLGAPLPEYKADHISEDSLEYNLEQNSNQTNSKIEEYNKIFNDDNILIHIEHLSKIDIEDISVEIIKSFIIKFLDNNFNSTNNDLDYYKCRIDGKYENILNEIQLDFFKVLINNYYEYNVSTQQSEQNDEKGSPMLASSSQIPLNPSSPNEEKAA